MPAAAEGPKSARSPHQVLLAAGFMALEGSELSKAAAQRSEWAASDIDERMGCDPPPQAWSTRRSSLMALS
jgi:hypothetical protein